MTEQRNDPDVRFWVSRKFWIASAITGALLALALTKTVVFSPEQILDFFKWLLGVLIGSHVMTDVTSLVISRSKEDRSRTTDYDWTIVDERKDEAK